jgi:CheY-like chemotaxis protein
MAYTCISGQQYTMVSETGRRALVVDDIAINRTTAKELLERLGWSVLTASGGREALELLDAQKCDLVLLDISGIEVCQCIRSTAALADLPVIAYTAHAQPEDRRNFIASGFDEVLVKPVDRATLAGALASVAQHRSLDGTAGNANDA